MFWRNCHLICEVFCDSRWLYIYVCYVNSTKWIVLLLLSLYWLRWYWYGYGLGSKIRFVTMSILGFHIQRKWTKSDCDLFAVSIWNGLFDVGCLSKMAEFGYCVNFLHSITWPVLRVFSSVCCQWWCMALRRRPIVIQVMDKVTLAVCMLSYKWPFNGPKPLLNSQGAIRYKWRVYRRGRLRGLCLAVQIFQLMMTIFLKSFKYHDWNVNVTCTS